MIKPRPCGSHTPQAEGTLLREPSPRPANGDPVMQLHHLQNFPVEILRDVQKILIAALFITVKNRNGSNTRNREPAKSTMTHIMEYQAVVKSCRNYLLTEAGDGS